MWLIRIKLYPLSKARKSFIIPFGLVVAVPLVDKQIFTIKICHLNLIEVPKSLFEASKESAGDCQTRIGDLVVRD